MENTQKNRRILAWEVLKSDMDSHVIEIMDAYRLDDALFQEDWQFLIVDGESPGFGVGRT